jgi:hypothetical protein
VRPPTTVAAYLAGPDVFLRNAVEHTTREVAICQRFSFRGLPLLNQDVETVAKGLTTWQAIFEKDAAMMEQPTSPTFWRMAASRARTGRWHETDQPHRSADVRPSDEHSLHHTAIL